MKKCLILTGVLLLLLLAVSLPVIFAQEYGAHRTELRPGDPRVTLIGFNLQTEIAQGDMVAGSLFFRASRPLEENLKVFFHLVRPGESQTVLNADFFPRYPTSRWEVNQVVEAGPFELAIPFNLPPGEYDVRAGLLQIVREETIVRYLREPYTNQNLENFTVGKLTVKEVAAPEREAAAELDLIAFDNEAELIFWEALGARVEFMGYSEGEEGSVSAARVTILPGITEYPGVILENFFRLRPQIADWSVYDTLQLRIYLPAESRGRDLLLQITDLAGKTYQTRLTLSPAATERIELSMVDLGGAINVSGISRIKFFLVNPSEPFIFYISGFRLISRGMATGKPAVTFSRMEIPEAIQRGRPFQVRFFFSIDQPIFQKHKMFTHVYRVNDLAGWTGADTELIPPVRDWPLNQEMAVESGPLLIPADAPPGTYVVRAGLYLIASSPGRGYVKVEDWLAYGGPEKVINIMQPTGPIDYIKQPYSNIEIQNWEVGTIIVQ